MTSMITSVVRAEQLFRMFSSGSRMITSAADAVIRTEDSLNACMTHCRNIRVGYDQFLCLSSYLLFARKKLLSKQSFHNSLGTPSNEYIRSIATAQKRTGTTRRVIDYTYGMNLSMYQFPKSILMENNSTPSK